MADVVDLGRERTMRRLVGEIRELTEAPSARARLDSYLAELAKEDDVATKTDMRTVRVPDVLWEGLRRMAAELADDPHLAVYGQVNISTVLRLAVSEWLADRLGPDWAQRQEPEQEEG